MKRLDDTHRFVIDDTIAPPGLMVLNYPISLNASAGGMRDAILDGMTVQSMAAK